MDENKSLPQDLQDALIMLGIEESPENPLGFSSPNYTQIPNDLLDALMQGMGDAELRVVLAICRMTYGYHRTHAIIGISDLKKMTGLSYNGVVNGAKDAEKRGLIRRVNPTEQTKAEWEIIEAPSASEGVKHKVPHPVRESPSPSEGQVGLNKDKEKNIKQTESFPSKENPLQNASLDWSIAANMTSEVVAGFAAREQAEKDRAILYEKLMGYGSLPWWNDKGLRRLLKFLLTKTPEEIKSFAEWSKRPYAGLNPVKARQYPNLVMECWNQAFDIEKRGSEPKEHAL
jgi:phage replication O-like protein O